MLQRILESLSALWVVEAWFRTSALLEILTPLRHDIHINIRHICFCIIDSNVHPIPLIQTANAKH